MLVTCGKTWGLRAVFSLWFSTRFINFVGVSLCFWYVTGGKLVVIKYVCEGELVVIYCCSGVTVVLIAV